MSDKNNCLSCFYSRNDEETCRLVCCNINSHNLWEYVDRSYLCDYYETMFQPTVSMEVKVVEDEVIKRHKGKKSRLMCKHCKYGCSTAVQGDVGVICRNDMSNHKGGFMNVDYVCNFYVSDEAENEEETSQDCCCDNCGHSSKYHKNGRYELICESDRSLNKDRSVEEDNFCNCWVAKPDVTEKIEDVSDNINHPERYNKHGMECIEEMVHVFGIDAVIGFCKCNAWKYRYRATCEDDAKKADWYINKLAELGKRKRDERRRR